MGNFANNAITDVGRMLLADVQAGAVFTPTRIVIGSGTMPSSATTQGMTDVITPVKSLQINKKKRTPDGKCIFGGVYTNEEVTVPFYFRELALYAKAVYLNEDGSVKSEGAEILYSYGNAGATADYMAAYSTSTVVEKQMDLVTWVGNNAQVDLTIESGVFVVQEDFASHATRHAADGEDPITPESIGAAPGGYGLGSYPQKTVSLADLDSIFDTGWYWLSQPGSVLSGVSFNYGNVLVHGIEPTSCTQELRPLSTNILLRRRCHLNSWGEWEVDNPPMEYGVEYRTAEQRNGKSVYKKLDTDGVLRYRLDGSDTWLTYAQENGAAPAGYGVGGPYYHIPPQSAITIKFDSDRNVVLIAVQGSQYTTRAVFAVNSFGIGGDTTYVERISGREGILYGITPVSDGNGVVIFNDTDDAVVRASILVLQGVYPTVTAGNSGVIAIPFEWKNPHMIFGTEYRTPERYNGAAVYKMVDAAGNVLWRAEYESSWHLLSAASYVSPATVE